MIPKIIHQIWIGNAPDETIQKAIQTWIDEHPDYKHILWDNDKVNEFIKIMYNKHLYELYGKEHKNIWNGRANLLRYEILYQYGGIYIDADSFCLNRLDDFFLNNNFWSVYENEKRRPGLINNAFFGTVPENEILKKIIDTLHTKKQVEQPSWIFSGPKLFTEIIKQYKNYTIYPSYMFMPRHARTQERYSGNQKIYADHYWGTSEKTYQKYTDKIYGVMITGLPGRKPMADIAVENFFEQTYPNKKLIIVNDGDYTFDPHPDIKEIKTDKKVLGELRNIGLNAVARNNIIIQWDDDDYKHPELMMRQYNELINSKADMCLLKKQLRYCFELNSGWVLDSVMGIHGTPMFYKRYNMIYPNKSRGEDTGFINRMRIAKQSIHVWDNHPVYYLRFIHGNNTWDNNHFKLDQRVRDKIELEEKFLKWFFYIVKRYRDVICINNGTS